MIDELLKYIALTSWDTGIVSQDAIIAVQTAVTSLLIPIAIMVLQDHEDTKPSWLFDVLLNECVKPLRLMSAAILPFIAVALLWATYPGWAIMSMLVCDIYFMKNITRTFRWFSCQHQSSQQTQSFKGVVVSQYLDKLNNESNKEFETLMQLWQETWAKPNSRMIVDIQPLLMRKFFKTIELSSDEHVPSLAITLFAAIGDNGISLLNYQTTSCMLDIAFYLIWHGYDAIGSNIIRLTTTSLSKVGPYGLVHRYANKYIAGREIGDELKYKIVKSITTIDQELITSRNNISPCRSWVEKANSDENSAITRGFLDAVSRRLLQLIDDYRRTTSDGDIATRYKIADTLDRTVSLCFPCANKRTIGDLLTLAYPPILVSSLDDNEPPLGKLIKAYDKYRGDYLLSDYMTELPIGPDEVGSCVDLEEINKIFDNKRRLAFEHSTQQAAKLVVKAGLRLSTGTIDELITYIDNTDKPSNSLLRLRNSLLSYKNAQAFNCVDVESASNSN